MNGAANLVPGGKPHQKVLRRRFKVDRLPPKAQAAVFRGFAGGHTYKKIQAEVKRLGTHISEGSLCHYWHAVWQAEHERLRQARANVALLKNALQLEPDSPSGQLAEELLYTIVFQKIPLIEQEGPLPLLREAREQQKLTAGKTPARKTDSDLNPVAQARHIRRRWRQLYGLETSNDVEQEKDEEN